MKKKSINKKTFTVGIPTCYGGESIYETVKSIKNSACNAEFDFIILADSKPIEDSLKTKLKKLGVRIFWN